jgi:inorganic pyrophosphatase
MPKKQSNLDLTRLKPIKKNGDTIRVVVETPKGSRNKYAFDPTDGVFVLKKVLPAGMLFPYDFGFVPRTQAEDGDPLDVLIFMDEPAFPGCILNCRLIGIIEGEQQEESGNKTRNDRFLAVEAGNHTFRDVHDVKDLPEHLVYAIGEFFTNYNRLEGRKFRVLGVRGAAHARSRIRRDIQAA